MKDRIDINSDALTLRRQMGEDYSSPVDVFALLNNQSNFTLVFHPMSSHISGMCIRDASNMIVAINSALTFGRQRFTAAHELCHLYFHNNFNTIICPRDIDEHHTPNEIEANRFASYFLAPHESLRDFIEVKLGKCKGNLDIADVVRIEQHYGLSRQATLWRLVDDGFITRAETEPMKIGIIRSALRLGFDDSLYLPTPTAKQYFTLGKYVQMTEVLREKELISSGKYEELLLEAFRVDIVYGINTEDDEIYE